MNMNKLSKLWYTFCTNTPFVTHNKHEQESLHDIVGAFMWDIRLVFSPTNSVEIERNELRAFVAGLRRLSKVATHTADHVERLLDVS